MITVLLLEDEKKIYELLSQALRKQGYSFVDEPQSGGIIKIIKKNSEAVTSLGEKIVELNDNLFITKNGQVYQAMLEEIERPLIEAVLERAEGNQLKAAKILGINRNTLRSKIKKLSINAGKWKV